MLLEGHPETVIMTVDDDVVYHSKTLAHLYKQITKYPNYIITNNCEVISNPNVKNNEILKWHHKVESKGLCRYGWVLGYHGVAYKVKFFTDNTIYRLQQAPAGCRSHDDVWISGIVRKSGYQIILSQPKFRVKSRHTKHANLSINSLQLREQLQIDCIHYFNNFKFKNILINKSKSKNKMKDKMKDKNKENEK